MAQNIEDIISTDKQAREIVQKAQARREQIMLNAAAERERLIKEGEEKLKNLKQRLKSENENYRAALEKANEEKLCAKKAELDSTYKENEEKWITNIFAALTENK